MSSQGKPILIVFGWVVFVLVLGLTFLTFSGSNLRRRWGKGHFLAYARGDGMGIVFSGIEPGDQTLLDQWLAETRDRRE
jgi:hypothetical protein